MSPLHSRSSAPHVDRPRLAPTWLILLLLILVGGALWLLYPRQNLEQRLAHSGESELSTNYLTNLLRSDPDNPRLRLLLAQRQIAHGETSSAHNTLQPALVADDPDVRRDALWAQWELGWYDYQHDRSHSPDQRRAQYQALRRQIHQLAQQTWPPARLLELARRASELGEHALALALSRQLAPSDPARAALFYAQAAQEALGRGDYAGCAQLYLAARHNTTDAQAAQRYYVAAVQALQSGNQPQAALALAEREIGPLADDPATLFLLTNLARAAGRPDVAEQYVRRLLHLALQRQWQAPLPALAQENGAARWQLQPARWQPRTALPPATAAPLYDDGAHWLRPPGLQVADKPANGPAPGLPFDDKTYLLGYEVFLENRNLADAWAVANAAVRQKPDDMAWRLRLAQVSEWTERPALALENWLQLARHGGQDAAWQAVLRLAPGQFDDAALTQALRHELASHPHDLALLRQYIDAQERLGEPRPALDYLRQHARQPQALQWLAQLAERAGEPGIALDAWRQLLAQPAERTIARALQAAVLALTQGQPQQGLDWLAAVQELPPENLDQAAELWRMTGGLAESRDHHALALAAYRRLVNTPEASIADYDGLIRLLLAPQPPEAAQIAWLAWETHQQPRHAIQALTLWSNTGAWAAMGRALAQLQAGAQAQALLRSQPQLLRLLGLYHQHQGQPLLARQFYEAALRTAPEADDMRQALLWLLIDGNDAPALRQLLAQHEAQWSASGEMHEGLASAYQALSLPQVALTRYLTPHLAEHEDDFLWLMNYADALEQNQQAERAWRLRRHLLARQWQAAHQGLDRAQARAQWLSQDGLDATRRMARARLVQSQNPGDPGLAVLRELLRLDRAAQDGSGYSNAAAEAAIGWLQDGGQYSAERGFLWQQYARSQGLAANRPLWAEISIALAEDDRTSTGTLLQTFDARLPRYDRINAAAAVHDTRHAQSAAFETQEQQPDDAPLHLQLAENLLAFSDHAGARVQYEQLGGMDELQAGSQLHVAIHPRLALDIELKSVRRSQVSPELLRNIPIEGIESVLLRWRHNDGETQLRAAHRAGYTHTAPLLLRHEQRLDNRLRLNAEIGRQLVSEDSLALRVAGMKTRAALQLAYQATRQDRLLLSHWRERYQLQTGTEVGSGRHSGVEYSHSYRQDAPGLEWGAFWSTHSYQRRDPADLGEQGLAFTQRFLAPAVGTPGLDYFLPDNFSFYGVQISTNLRYEQEYTRALQPYASLSRTWHSSLGPGFGLRLGLAGSVLGADHLALGFGLTRSGVQSLGLTRSLLLTYRLHF